MKSESILGGCLNCRKWYSKIIVQEKQKYSEIFNQNSIRYYCKLQYSILRIYATEREMRYDDHKSLTSIEKIKIHSYS